MGEKGESLSIHKTRNGTYQVKWRANGRQRSKTFKRAIDAQKFKAKLIIDPSGRSRIESDARTFNDLAEEWLAKYASIKKEESSIKMDRGDLRKHILPVFGQVRLDKIKQSDLEWFRADLKNEKNLSNKTINNVMGLMGTMLKMAVEWDYISVDPSKKIQRLELVDGEVNFWTFGELDRFLSYAKASDKTLHDVVAFAAHTGLRRGEIEGLRRDCLDFQRKEILVKRFYCAHTRTIVERTKGKKARRVPMNALVYDILKEKALLPMRSPVFPGVNFHRLARKKMDPIAAKLGITRIRFHDLRHTFGSHLAMLGVPVMKIKEVMGHTHIETTMRYMHLAPGSLDGLTDVLLERSGSPAPTRLRSV